MLEPRRPVLAIAIGWLTAFLPSLLLGAAVNGLLPDAAQPQFAVNGAAAIVMIVLVAPLLETLIMGGVLLILLRYWKPWIAVVASAAGWGIAHSLAAPAWGLVIWWPFLIFSALFVTWRTRSVTAGMAVAAATHALQNSLPALLLFAGVRA